MKTIVLDLGHDTISDNKNIGYSKKYYEHLGNWEYGLKLKQELEKYDFKVILTRNENNPLSLTNRARVGITNKADIFISIHSDAFDINANGTTVFYSVNRPDDKIIAERIGKVVASSYGVRARGIWTKSSSKNAGLDYYSVINVAANYKKMGYGNYEIPHVFLIERCFHSNPTEERLLLDENISSKSAKDLAKELNDIFNGGSKMNKITTGEEAVKWLVDNQIISDRDYWVKAILVVKYLEDLLVKIVNYIIENT